jgi:hypothetical protein
MYTILLFLTQRKSNMDREIEKGIRYSKNKQKKKYLKKQNNKKEHKHFFVLLLINTENSMASGTIKYTIEDPNVL